MTKDRAQEVRKEALIRLRDAIYSDIHKLWNEPNRTQFTQKELETIIETMRQVGHEFHKQANEET